MKENINYISDEKLEQLICQVEQTELVSAPPDLEETILEAAGLVPESIRIKPKASGKKEFYAYCFRVISSVAAAVALVFLLPETTEWIGKTNVAPDFIKTVYRREIPAPEEVVATVPSKSEVVAVKPAPSKEEVLSDTGVIERFIRNAGWLGNENRK